VIEDVIGPKALESVQRSVQDQELIRIDSADLFNGTHVLSTESLDDVTHIPAFVGELDAYRAAVYAAALVIEKSRRDELLEIVGDIRAQIVASRDQFARGQFPVADVVEQQSLYGIDVHPATTIEVKASR
jgi:hypothetical protein